MKEKNVIFIKSIALEVTRHCNETCTHCMRGNSQNIDMEKEVIDSLLEKNLIIMKLVFSGGEPTLNEELIAYTIEKIIEQEKNIFQIEITTNGRIYSKKIVEEFKRFKEYAKKKFSSFIKEEELSVIRISNDQFHKVEEEVVDKYVREKELTIKKTETLDILDDEILLTGRAKNRVFGRYFEYKLEAIDKKEIEPGILYLNNNFYITATGNITTQGNGTYEDMDIINLGQLEKYDFRDPENKKIKK